MQLDFQGQLRQLSVTHALIFVASCAERMYPNYLAFAQSQQWGNPEVLRNGLDTLWFLASGKVLREEEIQSLIESCQEVVPDSEDFRSLLTSAAQYAVIAVVHGLSCYLEQDGSLAEQVSVAALETVRDYLYQVNSVTIEPHAQNTELEEWIERSPLLRAEQDHQEQDLALLTSMSEDDTKLQDTLHQSSLLGGIRPLDRGFYAVV